MISKIYTTYSLYSTDPVKFHFEKFNASFMICYVMMQYVCHQKRRMVCVSVKNYLPIFAFIASRQFLIFFFVIIIAVVTPSSCCVVFSFFSSNLMEIKKLAAFTHLETTRLIYLCAAFPKWLPSKNSPCYEIVL